VSSLEKLYQSPLSTAKEFAVAVGGATGTVPGTLRPKPTATAHDLTFMQVKASVPVYAKCQAEAGCLSISATDRGTAGTRVYFLPWAHQEIYRIRPTAGNTPGLNGNLFFTPNLDGCMITVEGTPQNPTIYHSNASGMLTANEQNEVDRASNQHIVENSFRIRKMQTDQAVFGGIASKNPAKNPSNPLKTAHFDLLEYSPQKPEVEITQTAEGDYSRHDYHYGTVFGVRKDGAWTFYKQIYQVVKKKWRWEERGLLGWGKLESVEREHYTYSVASIKQFWP
jgi:hypothetical protein